jgi:hypothetical protein
VFNAVDFNLFDKPRHLKFDLNALADAEREVKSGIIALFNEERMGVDTVRIFIWAGLKHEDKALTINEVGEMIEDYIINSGEDLMEALSELQNVIMEGIMASKVFKTMFDKSNKENAKDESEGNLEAGEA